MNDETGAGEGLSAQPDSTPLVGREDRREDRPSMYYGVSAPDGTVVYSNGNAVYARSPEGKRERLIKGERITEGVLL